MLSERPESGTFPTQPHTFPRASSQAHFGVTQNRTCGTEQFMRVSRPAFLSHGVYTSCTGREADPVFQNAARGWPPCSSGCPRSDSV
eukprot:6400283-Prymnesium_polylepis.1